MVKNKYPILTLLIMNNENRTSQQERNVHEGRQDLTERLGGEVKFSPATPDSVSYSLSILSAEERLIVYAMALHIDNNFRASGSHYFD